MLDKAFKALACQCIKCIKSSTCGWWFKTRRLVESLEPNSILRLECCMGPTKECGPIGT